jgi:hypothetical protein
MRTLHVYRTYTPPGGTQEIIRNLCLATRPWGVQSRIFALSSGDHPAEVNLPEGTAATLKLAEVEHFLHFPALRPLLGLRPRQGRCSTILVIA